jgi:hypothetical protein
MRTGSNLLRLVSMLTWLALGIYLLYTRQPVPAVLVACAGIADQLCLRGSMERLSGFLAVQAPWLVTLVIVSLAASQWI